MRRVGEFFSFTLVIYQRADGMFNVDFVLIKKLLITSSVPYHCIV